MTKVKKDLLINFRYDNNLCEDITFYSTMKYKRTGIEAFTYLTVEQFYIHFYKTMI